MFILTPKPVAKNAELRRAPPVVMLVSANVITRPAASAAFALFTPTANEVAVCTAIVLAAAMVIPVLL